MSTERTQDRIHATCARARASRQVLLAALALGLAACGGGEQQPAAGPATAPAATPAPAAPVAAQPAPVPVVPELTVPELLKAGSLALTEQRLVAPAGNNAMEYYLKVLEKDKANVHASQALVDIFPLAVNVVERSINQKQIDEADRMVKLLDQASPTSYTVTTIRSKLEAARSTVARELAATQLAQQQAATTAQAAAQQAAAQRAADAARPATPAPAPAQPVATAPAPPPVAPPPAPVPEPVAPVGETRDVAVLRQVPPDYPPDAFRKRTEGWVELEITVGADGKASSVVVSRAQPARVFDREAIRAVQQWTFQPALRDGRAVEGKMRRRMEFKLNG